jgi:allantoinase
MSDIDLIVRGRRIVTRAGIRPGAVHVRRGRIAAVTSMNDGRAADTYEAGDLVVMPGLVDTHVHINEPGRTEWEGFDSATRAAAAGGITTVVDMPLNSVPATTSTDGLRAKQQAAAGQCWVDVGFWGGIVPGNAGALPALAEGGALGFKCFLVPSGVDEFPAVSRADLVTAMPFLAARRLPLLAHAESPGLIKDLAGPGPLRRYADYLATRPPEAEHEAVALLVDLCRQTSAPIHIVHVSSPDTARLVRDARHERLAVSAETCPHYLTFAADDIADGATEFKCAPPIRRAADRSGLWQALLDGNLQMVATDHSPAPAALKYRDSGDFRLAWGGIASLQVSLPAVWSAARSRGVAIDRLALWLSEAPARLAGLHGRKGAIAEGFDADFVVWDPDAAFIVDPAVLHHRHPLTPYAGRPLQGVVHTTFLRGQRIYDRGTFLSSPSGLQIAKRHGTDS